MKATLVIDMPSCCAECPLMLWDAESEYYGACCPTLKEVNCVADSYKENENKGTKPNWCPLKPLPPHEKALMFGSEFETFSEKVGEIVLDAIGDTDESMVKK